jgi:hypothetical protein
MPSKRNTANKIVAGHQTVSTVNAATAIKSFALVSDQTLSYPWVAPSTFLSSIPTRRVVRFANGGSKPHGAYQYQWGFNYWTVGMWNYFRSQYLTTEDTSALVTTLQYDENDVAIYMQSTLHYPRWGDGLTPVGIGGYRVRLDFTNGTEIT